MNKRNISGAICMAVFALALILVGCPSPTDNKGSAEPTKTSPGISLNTMERMLTLSFDKNIKSVKDKGKIIVYKKSADATPPPLKIDQDKFTATAINGKLVITLVDAITAGDIFYVELQASAVTDEDDVPNADTITSQEITISNVFVTAFAIDKTARTLTLTFNTGLVAKDDSKIEVYKGDTVLEPSAYTIGAIDSGDAKTLVITLTDIIGVSDTYTVKFTAGALTVDDELSEAFEIEIDTSGPGFAHPADALSLDVASKTLTVSFNRVITSKTDGNIKVLKTPKAGGVEAPLTLITDYTIAIDGTKVVIPLKALNEGDTYKVQFLADAVKGTNTIGNAEITTETETVVPQPPTLKSKIFRLVTKQLVVTFKKAIAMKDTSKIEVYKDGTKFTSGTDYTVAPSADKTKVEITLTTAPSKGQKYQVKFLPGAVQDAVNKKQSEAFEIEIDTSVPSFAHPEDAISLDVASKTLTVSFNKEIFLFYHGIKVLKTSIDGTETTLTINRDYTISSNGAKIIITLTAAKLTDGDTYTVEFKAGTVRDINTIGNEAITTEAETVPAPPTLKYTTPVLNGNTLTATFRNAIAILSKSKIEVYKDGTKFTSGTDYTVAINSADKTKVEITLRAAASKDQKYQVKFLAGAVEDVVNKKPNGNLETKVLTIGSFIWTKATDAAEWPAREGHASVVFKNKLWVLGGQVGNDEQNDVWNSEDGVTWTKATDAAEWPAREGHTSVVFKNKIWVMGGCGGTLPGNTNRSGCYRSATKYNDVWSSADGVTWNRVRASANAADDSMWDIRSYHTSVVFGGKLWVIGGTARNSTKWPDGRGMFMNDMWNSADGSAWTKIKTQTTPVWINYKGNKGGPFSHDKAPERFIIEWKPKAGYELWSTRYAHTSVVFGGKLWVIGGSSGKRNNYRFHRRAKASKEYPWKTAYKHDVWSSADGINWDELTETASWGIRRNHASVVFGNKLWVMGGRTKGSGKDRVSVNDVWSSADGQVWTQMADADWWSNRDNHTIVEFKGRIWIMGGATKRGTGKWNKDNDIQYNDVWYYGLPLP